MPEVGCRLIPVNEAAASERPLRHAADIHVSSCRVKAAPRSAAVPVLSVQAASTVSAKQRRSLHSYTLMFSSASFGSEQFVEAPKRSLLHRNELPHQSSTSYFCGRIHQLTGENTLVPDHERRRTVLLIRSYVVVAGWRDSCKC